jgi:hypothetical protein
LAPLTLLDVDVSAGEKLVRAMDDGLPPYLALWWRSEAEEYRFIASAKLNSEDLQNAYLKAREVLYSNDLAEEIPLDRVQVLGPEDALAKALPRITRMAADAVAKTRVRQARVDDIWIEDAPVYRAVPAPRGAR